MGDVQLQHGVWFLELVQVPSVLLNHHEVMMDAVYLDEHSTR